MRSEESADRSRAARIEIYTKEPDRDTVLSVYEIDARCNRIVFHPAFGVSGCIVADDGTESEPICGVLIERHSGPISG